MQLFVCFFFFFLFFLSFYYRPVTRTGGANQRLTGARRTRVEKGDLSLGITIGRELIHAFDVGSKRWHCVLAAPNVLIVHETDFLWAGLLTGRRW